MCGIVVAAADNNNIVPVLVVGLKTLEYRGYDSAGLAVIGSVGIKRIRSVGRVAELESNAAGTHSVTGIAHTRWATHGVPSERNAHPHISGSIGLTDTGYLAASEVSALLHVTRNMVYHATLVNGTDVDKPSNLARSVTTVE